MINIYYNKARENDNRDPINDDAQYKRSFNSMIDFHNYIQHYTQIKYQNFPKIKVDDEYKRDNMLMNNSFMYYDINDLDINHVKQVTINNYIHYNYDGSNTYISDEFQKSIMPHLEAEKKYQEYLNSRKSNELIL